MSKRRGNQTGSIFQLANGTWRALFSVDGKRLSFSAKTYRECQEWLDRIKNQINSGLTYLGANMRLGEYLNIWMTTIKENRRQKTFIQYQGLVHKYILPTFGDCRMRDLQSIQIERYLNQKKAEGVGDRTCQLIYSVLHAALHAAVKKGLIGRNPMDAVEKPKVRNPRAIITLEPAQIQQLLVTAAGDRNEMLYHLAVATGLREGELLGLKWEDIDCDRQKIRIKRQLQYIPHVGLVFSSPKTKAGIRTVSIGVRTMDKLIKHRLKLQGERTAAGDRWQDNDLVFPTPLGTPQDPNNLMKHFKVLLQKAGLPLMRFHDLRHTSITLVLNDLGAPVKEAQRRAGHATPSTTINIYGGEATSKLDETVAESLDELIIPVQIELPEKDIKSRNRSNM